MAALPGSTTVFTIRGPLDRADLPGLCERLRASLEDGQIATAFCDVDRLVASDLVTVDALARLQLAARRLGCGVRLRDAPLDLQDLLACLGLDGVVPRGDLRVESRREPEQREQPVGIEEERELVDPAT
jgi:ABC-type transporter Mla MlaB component